MQELGIAVPAALTVVGFDDLSLDRVARTTLTTVAGSRTDLGQQAAETLEHHLATGHDTIPSYLPMTLHPGATSGPRPQ